MFVVYVGVNLQTIFFVFEIPVSFCEILLLLFLLCNSYDIQLKCCDGIAASSNVLQD